VELLELPEMMVALVGQHLGMLAQLLLAAVVVDRQMLQLLRQPGARLEPEPRLMVV